MQIHAYRDVREASTVTSMSAKMHEEGGVIVDKSLFFAGSPRLDIGAVAR